jgi:hypothetical protein
MAATDTSPPRSHGDQDPQREVPSATTAAERPAIRIFLTFAPTIVVTLTSVAALTTHDVDAIDIARFALYWVVCIIVPGMLVTRAIVGVRSTLTEDVAVGALVGLALESVAFVALDAIGAHAAIRWWWLPTIVAFMAVPQLRRCWTEKPACRSTVGSAWSLAAMSMIGVVIATSTLRARPLSPAPSAPYVDDLFHLSLVNELMREGPHQVPQVVGETLTYHVFSHAHVANASTITGVTPEVVLFRLWMIPLIVLTITLISVLAVRVTNRNWTGPIAVWLSIAGLAGNSIWVDRSATITSPIITGSPSQLVANPVFVGGCLALVGVMRSTRPRGWAGLFTLLLVLGVGTKPTVLPALFGAAAASSAAAWVVRRRPPAELVYCAGAILVIQFGWMLVSPPVEGKFTVLGSIDSLSVFREVNGSGGLRAVSETLLLDRLDDGRAWLAAGIAVLWLAAVQATRLVGLATLATSATRRDPVAWGLSGAYLAGWGLFFVIDQAGFGQAYFAITVIPAGAVLSCWLLATQLDRLEANERRTVVVVGLGAGISTSLVVRGLMSGRAASSSYGPVESALLPVLLVLAIGLAAWIGVRLWSAHRPGPGVVYAAGLTALLALSAAPALNALSGIAGTSFTERPAIDESSAGFVTGPEQEAMRWLRDNTPDDAVVATNLHCRPPDSAAESCDARAFLVSGLGGRRVVLEGWAYTPEAQTQHGVDGRSFAVQPSPWPERYDISMAAVESPTTSVLDRLADEYGTGWIVAFQRAGPVSSELGRLTETVYENTDVAVFRLRPGP